MSKQKSHKIIWIFVILICIIGAALAAFFIIKGLSSNNLSAEPSSETTSVTEPEKPKLISLQSTVENWANSLSQGEAGVVIYDLDNDQIVADLNSNTTFFTESLYKLFVTYEGYHQVEIGNISASDYITRSHTWGACLDLAIRESNSPCGEAMRSYFGIDNMNNIIATTYNMPNTNIGNLTSTPADIAQMMQIYYKHKGLSAATWAKIQDSMLNQPPVDNGFCSGKCNWRQGLPSGFTAANVYNKVGWRHSGRGNTWTSYHDAAIVEFPELKRHYIVVVMTKNSLLKDVVNLGQRIEESVLSNH